jgi:tetrahydromethanopterin S-methyltransferase subunit B
MTNEDTSIESSSQDDMFLALEPSIDHMSDQMDQQVVNELHELNESLSKLYQSITKLEQNVDIVDTLKTTDVKRSVEKVRHKAKLAQISAEGVLPGLSSHEILPHMFSVGENINDILVIVEQVSSMVVFNDLGSQVEQIKKALDQIHDHMQKGMQVNVEAHHEEKHARKFSFASLFGLVKEDYSKQLQELSEMGFSDTKKCEELLKSNRGDVQAVIQKLLQE